MKKTVHIISHSHLDREWYLPLIAHQFNLVDLIDNLLILSKDKRFNSFHLDGQIIPLEDYFNIKPENKEQVLKIIKEGKLKVGPFYILQDEFLISSEANLRNIQIGQYESNKYVKDIKKEMWIGYFPDTFGNAGQIPQILRRSGIDIAYFGRGVKAVGFDNQVFDDYSSNNSEMYWKSEDGSKVLGILFANWYSNGNEIPVNRLKAKEFWDKKLKEAEQFASTNHILMMNGCDHQPLQMDILDAIDVANELYPDYNFIHSNLFDYYESVKKEIEEKGIKLTTITGELRSQNTDGFWTLQGTNSNRVYLKVENKKCEFLLEEVLEPLMASIDNNDNYKVNYLWKKLLSNHPHDSICGCGIDSIHKGMEERFKEVLEGADYLIKENLKYFEKNINTINYKEDYLFTIHNYTEYSGIKETEVSIDLERIYFDEMYFKDIYLNLEKKEHPKSVKIYDGDKFIYETNIKKYEVVFDYELPKDKFRKPYFARRVYFKSRLFMDKFSRKTLILKFSNEEIEKKYNYSILENIVETDKLKISINNNGTINLLNKEINKEFKNLLVIENTGDIGNEYIFKETNGDRIYSNQFFSEYIVERKDSETVLIKIYDNLKIPKRASNKLENEQKKLVEVFDRELDRDSETVILKILKEIEIKSYSDTLKINIKFLNNAMDHRLRILFETDIISNYVYPESIYGVEKRNVHKYKNWKNKDFSQNMNRFVNYRNENYGITIGSLGIAEYEIINEKVVALTLGRYTGEMGDWGYFKTIDSQGNRQFDLELYLNIHGKDYISSYHKVLEKRKIYLSNQVYSQNKGYLEANKVENIDVSNNFLTAYKFNMNGDKIIRICNYTSNENNIILKKAKEYSILEDEIINSNIGEKIEINKYEIRTFGWENNEKSSR